MLACARIGAVHSVVFAGFSSDSLRDRILDASSKWVVTADEGKRGGKTIPLKKTTDVAVAQAACVSKVFVYAHTGADVPMGFHDVQMAAELAAARPYCPAVAQDAEDLLFLLYTSGSTGKPKGIAHSSAGYILYAALTHKYVFDVRPGDVYACVADAGWITGHSYIIYGPLANGATTLMFESTPMYPDASRCEGGRGGCCGPRPGAHSPACGARTHRTLIAPSPPSPPHPLAGTGTLCRRTR